MKTLENEVVKETMLDWYHDMSSDKEYYLRIVKQKVTNDYRIEVKFGRRGKIGNLYTFAEGPLDEMEKVYESQVRKKLAKGYQYSDKMLDMI